MNYKSLQSIPSQTAQENPVMRFHYLVTYNGGNNVLTPNQVLPVWDSQNLKLVNSYEVRSYMAVLLGDKVITEPGAECPSLDKLQDLVEVSTIDDPSLLRDRAILGATELGAIGGERLIRPDMVASSGIPLMRRVSEQGKPQFEAHPMSVLEWFQDLGEMPLDRTGHLPLPQFYCRDPHGHFEGIDPLNPGDPVRLSLFPIPFGWDSAEGLGLTQPEIYGEADFLMAMTASVRRMVRERGIQGHIYLGWNVPACNEGVAMAHELPLSMDEYLDGGGFENPVYELPYDVSNPMAALHPGLGSAINRVRGRRSVRRDYNPGPTVGAPRSLSEVLAS